MSCPSSTGDDGDAVTGLDSSFGTGGMTVVGSVSAGTGVALTAAGDLLATGEKSGGAGVTVAFSPLAASAGTGLTQRLYAEQAADDNVTSLTNAAGAVVERYAYDPYGNVTVENPDGTVRGDGTAASSSYGWVYLHQGLRLDVATNTYDDEHRVYIVSLGRFAQEDPAGYLDGPNRYQLEESNSVIHQDFSGKGSYPLPGVGPFPITSGPVVPSQIPPSSPGPLPPGTIVLVPVIPPTPTPAPMVPYTPPAYNPPPLVPGVNYTPPAWEKPTQDICADTAFVAGGAAIAVAAPGGVLAYKLGGALLSECAAIFKDGRKYGWW